MENRELEPWERDSLDIDVLSKRCVATYTPEDIIKHLKEECCELMLSWYRVDREREGLETFLEELIDVGIEINTVCTMLDSMGLIDDEMGNAMLDAKLAKFKAMLDRDELKPGEAKKTRYKGLKGKQ